MLITFKIEKETYETINISELFNYNLSRIKYLEITKSLIIDLRNKK